MEPQHLLTAALGQQLPEESWMKQLTAQQLGQLTEE